MQGQLSMGQQWKIANYHHSFEKANDGIVKYSNGSKIAFIEEEQVKNAEILQVLNIVQNNPSFSSTNGDNEQFKQMLTD